MKLNDSEWQIMDRVWERGSASAREVHNRLAAETGWSYSTVRTLMNRLVEKGGLAAESRGNTKIYSASLNREQAQASALSGLLDKAFDGLFGNLGHYLVKEKRLNAGQRKQLEALLAALDDNQAANDD